MRTLLSRSATNASPCLCILGPSPRASRETIRQRTTRMTVTSAELQVKGEAARRASRRLAALSTEIKNQALLNTAEALVAQQAQVLDANAADYAQARDAGLSEAMLDRMRLDEARIASIAADVRTI